ncbi:autophagy-related protein 9A-like [Saccoglossus kowalevskii]|uniref:Autophagy-related protein 9 n=1 Tax=Saccoglossus kowalevskii TaxID=10224 RepID=A0ABM0MYK5_SACKO|nr:PREDICTED: autophagy-related protein 9A-like [Saccoglossus kowalevskii]
MAHLETSYRRLDSYYDEESELPPHERDLNIHVPENGKARWNHIENLDEFFARVYHYHQKHGFSCMMLSEVFELVQFIFIVLFSTFLLQCVDYAVLFGESKDDPKEKVTLGDAIIPLDQCTSSLDPIIVICIIIAGVFWILRLVKVIYHFFQFWEIKSFYTNALKISTEELLNTTWHEVLKKVQQVQKEQQMCIHKAELTELDIYHRILRFKNYMVAMVNKELLPIRIFLPFVGDIIFLTNGYKYNLEMILFWGPWSPFENNWHLREDYKRSGKRQELAKMLSRRILWIGIANFLLSPFIFLWQILYSFFSYADLIKRQPGTLGARRWSNYGRLYLRHFNELDHEFQARLARGYKPSSKYMDVFVSEMLAVVAQNIAFFAASILAVLLLLTVYDEDVLTVEHVLTLMTILGLIVTCCRLFIPDDHLVWCPETLMQSVLAQIHYIPDDVKGTAHTWEARNKFSRLFQYKAVHYLEELLSPLITPYILCFKLRYKALDIVDFYHNFTVDVVGVGDVCSFAQMDIRKHGNPQWMSDGKSEATQYQQAEDGKCELSLMHFTMTNPKWQPPQDCNMYISALKHQAQKDVGLLGRVEAENTALAMSTSLTSLQSIEGGYNTLLNSIVLQQSLLCGPTYLPGYGPATSMSPALTNTTSTGPVRGALNKTEGPLKSSGNGLLGSVHSSTLMSNSIQCSVGSSPISSANVAANIADYTTADMNFSAVYMHQLHDRKVELHGSGQLEWQSEEERERRHWSASESPDRTTLASPLHSQLPRIPVKDVRDQVLEEDSQEEEIDDDDRPPTEHLLVDVTDARPDGASSI